MWTPRELFMFPASPAGSQYRGRQPLPTLPGALDVDVLAAMQVGLWNHIHCNPSMMPIVSANVVSNGFPNERFRFDHL